MPIRFVVFDLFDTLVDLRFEKLPRVEIAGRRVPSTTRELYEAVRARAALSFDDFAERLLEVDRELRESRYAEGRECPTEERFGALVARLGIEDPELPERLTAIHMGILRSLVEVPPHHAGVLDALRRDVRIGLCSNFSHGATAERILGDSGLRRRLDAVAISDAVGIRKPRREIFDAVLDALGAAPGETLHVGDSLRADVAGAASLGLRTAWLTRRVPDPGAALEAHAGPPPDHTVRDLSEVAALLG